MSDALIWQITRKQSSFRTGATRDGKVFSKEPGNIPSLHSFKYSLLANSKALGVDLSSNFSNDASIILTTRTGGGKKLRRNVLKRGGSRRKMATVRCVASLVRPDLARDAVRKASCLGVAARNLKKI